MAEVEALTSGLDVSEMAISYLVLGSPPADAAFIDIIDDSLGELEDRLGLDLTYAELQDRGEDLLVHVYASVDGAVRVSVVEEERTPVHYLTVEAPTQEIVDDLASFLDEHLPVQDLASLQSLARHESAENPGILVKLAIASAGPDEVTDSIIRDALGSRDHSVLRAAIEAASLTRWPSFAGALADHYQKHPDKSIRELSGRALNALVMGNPSGS
ncbi:hypothetical protein [Streptomyces chattanoogensis]|uniref:hypothetical protein n=1 Tax=Streptomyces chattanoogensis TaxID=66876 RepID=UPI0036CF0BB9